MPEQIKIGTVHKMVVEDNRGRSCKAINESLNDELKTRVDGESLKHVMAFCRGRGIDRSKYLRQLIDLDTSYFDLIQVLNAETEILIPLLNKLRKNF